MGFVNNALGVRALGYLEPDPAARAAGSAWSPIPARRSPRCCGPGADSGIRLAVSSGQELVTDTADYVEYALDDPGTKVLALLMETPRAAPRLRRALRRAAERRDPW